MPQSNSVYRARFAATLAHGPVDRPPMDLGATDMTGIDGGLGSLAPDLDLDGPLGPDLDEAVLQALDIDIRGVGGILTPAGTQSRWLSPTEFVDAWGIRYAWQGHHHEMVGHPLAGATLDDLERYPWPDAERLDRDDLERLTARARYLYEETPYVVCGRHPVFGVLELGCWMCGFGDFLYRLAAEPEFVARFFDIVWAYQRRVLEIYYGALGPYLHFTTCGDDFGSQKGPLMAPAMFAEQVKPRLAERIAYTRRFTDAAFFHHTCGSVCALIPDLLEAGVEILNPVQPSAQDMEPDRLKPAFGDRLTFYGGIDTQWLLPHGTVEEVEAGVRAVIRILGRDGGYVLSAAHTLQEDVPAANVLAMYRAGRGR